MNKSYLGTNVGKYVQLRAIAVHLDESDSELPQQDDDWLIEDYSTDGVLQIRNTRTGSVGYLSHDNVQSYRENPVRGAGYGHLMMLAQTFVRGDQVIFEPVTRPGERLEYRPRSLVSEALLEASLDCHFWKILMMNTFVGQGVPEPTSAAGEFVDVWDFLEAKWIPPYSRETCERYAPIFDDGLKDMRRRFDRLLQLFQSALPKDYQAELVRAARQLQAERQAYIFIPVMPGTASPDVDLDMMFRGRFVGVINVLRRCAREADRRRDELKATTG